tara:strand:- start:550 stop:1254 length:705 start_codon:yes stop_codon:yes gene_type:complete
MDYKDYLVGNSEENFWFKSKNDLIKIFFKKFKKKDLKILSIGAGTGRELKVLNEFGEVFVIEINKKALDLISKELCQNKKQGDVQNLPFSKDFFDIVLASDVLEHVNDDKKAVNEIQRVLKKEGTFIFTVPAHQFIFSSHDKALGHKKRYSKEELKQLTKKFKKVEINYWNFFLSPIVILKRILNKDSKPEVDKITLPKTIDTLFYRIMSLENGLIARDMHLPFGITLFGICKK